jgi:hypothetical protein
MRARLPAALLAAAALSSAAPFAARAQDVEMGARVSGRALPAAYRERVRRRPHFFEVARGWTARVALAQQAGGAVAGTLPIAVVPALFANSATRFPSARPTSCPMTIPPRAGERTTWGAKSRTLAAISSPQASASPGCWRTSAHCMKPGLCSPEVSRK